MNLGKQVCSAEIAIKLKDFNIKQQSYFRWIKAESGRDKCPDCKTAGFLIPECFYCGGTGKGEKYQNYRLYPTKECLFDNRGLGFSAFTVAELGEMLPKNVYWTSVSGFTENAWSCELDGHREAADTEADARAKMLIYLIENGLLKP